jgi:hypothetical protein
MSDDPRDLREPRSDELDGLRIRRLAAVRKAAYRARSYCIIASVACLVLAIQLGWTAVHRKSAVPGLIAIAAVICCVSLLKRSRRLHREATQSSLEIPAIPPDFSTLSDGSQRWKDLDNITD